MNQRLAATAFLALSFLGTAEALAYRRSDDRGDGRSRGGMQAPSAVRRPASTRPAPNTVEHCRFVSQRAVETGTNVMVIGVEGLLQLDGGYAAQLDRYSEAVKAGEPVSIPKAPYSPVFLLPAGQAGVTRGLLIPLMRNSGKRVEPIVVGQESIEPGRNSVAQECARIWVTGGKGRKIVIAGHSWGGPAALDLTNNLKAAGIPVDALYTIDAVERNASRPMAYPTYPGYWANFWQINPKSGEPFSAKKTNNHQVNWGHMSIPGHPSILADLESKIAGFPVPKAPAAKKTKARPSREAYEEPDAEGGAGSAY